MPQLYSSNYESLNNYFHIIADVLKKHKFSIRGKSILEIGPGNSYINAYNFLLSGASDVVLIDKYPRYLDTERQRTYVKNEIEYFKFKYHVKTFKYINTETFGLNPDYLRFIPGDLRAVGLDHNVDFIYSIAVLHHIRELEKYVQKMSELLNRGGMMYHVVDLKDKLYFFGNPFLFYKYSDYVWDNILTEETVTYTNRVRYQDYVDMFKRSGFDLLWKKTISHDYPQFRINKKFAGRSDLNIGDAHFLLRKR
jgi:SAM-dependent methyltransferase